MYQRPRTLNVEVRFPSRAGLKSLSSNSIYWIFRMPTIIMDPDITKTFYFGRVYHCMYLYTVLHSANDVPEVPVNLTGKIPNWFGNLIHKCNPHDRHTSFLKLFGVMMSSFFKK